LCALQRATKGWDVSLSFKTTLLLFFDQKYLKFRSGDFSTPYPSICGSTIFEWLWISELRSLALRSSLIATLFFLK